MSIISAAAVFFFVLVFQSILFSKISNLRNSTILGVALFGASSIFMMVHPGLALLIGAFLYTATFFSLYTQDVLPRVSEETALHYCVTFWLQLWFEKNTTIGQPIQYFVFICTVIFFLQVLTKAPLTKTIQLSNYALFLLVIIATAITSTLAQSIQIMTAGNIQSWTPSLLTQTSLQMYLFLTPVLGILYFLPVAKHGGYSFRERVSGLKNYLRLLITKSDDAKNTWKFWASVALGTVATLLSIQTGNDSIIQPSLAFLLTTTAMHTLLNGNLKKKRISVSSTIS